MVAIVSFLAPLAGEGAGFLRVLRTLRLLHTYQLLARLRADSDWFRRNEELTITIVHLAVFLFVMTAIVYETQHWTNPQIKNYIDALYFTVTALTTTGFGDVTLEGTAGRLISVVIMIFGVTLFLRLIRALLQPHKVRFACPTCGLQRHDFDAVHCKACGTTFNIPDEGMTLLTYPSLVKQPGSPPVRPRPDEKRHPVMTTKQGCQMGGPLTRGQSGA